MRYLILLLASLALFACAETDSVEMLNPPTEEGAEKPADEGEPLTIDVEGETYQLLTGAQNTRLSEASALECDAKYDFGEDKRNVPEELATYVAVQAGENGYDEELEIMNFYGEASGCALAFSTDVRERGGRMGSVSVFVIPNSDGGEERIVNWLMQPCEALVEDATSEGQIVSEQLRGGLSFMGIGALGGAARYDEITNIEATGDGQYCEVAFDLTWHRITNEQSGPARAVLSYNPAGEWSGISFEAG